MLQVDASGVGIGAVQYQEVDGSRRPVVFLSKKFTRPQRKYSTVEKEAFAVVWSIQQVHKYVYGTHFVVETDHAPLQFLFQHKDSNGRIMRWTMMLQVYSFTVRYIKGRDNVVADALSRGL